MGAVFLAEAFGSLERMGFENGESTLLSWEHLSPCGALFQMGFVTRLAAIPLIYIMLTDIVTTKYLSCSATTSAGFRCASYNTVAGCYYRGKRDGG